jgi:predicted SAM-dependent methyltransferase
MLHIGCGDVHLDGWVNIDLDSPKADLKHDLRQPLPYAGGSVEFIYNEHFMEHLTVQEGVAFLRECHRLLKPGGVLRVATPDLRYVAFRYFFRWKKQDWIRQYRYEWIQTRAEMMNMMFHEWGHRYLYDEEELRRRLTEAGFLTIVRRRLLRSPHPALRNRETRKDSKLILEATR